MPTYCYRCWDCDGEQEVVKPVVSMTEREFCKFCGGEMERVIRFRGHVADDLQPQFHYAFGKHISSKRDVKEELRRLRYEHGRDFEEVGNERYKPKREPTDWITPEVIEEYKRIRRGD